MRIGVFILSRDIYCPKDQESWDLALEMARKRLHDPSIGLEQISPDWLYDYNRREKRTPIPDLERWAIIYEIYREMIRLDPSLRGQIIMIRNHYERNDLEWDGDILVVNNYLDESLVHGHFIYKTVESFRKTEPFDYYVRSGLSSLIDVRKLQYVMERQNMPKHRCYTAPFWDAGDWSYGAFILCSPDIVQRMLTHPDPKWYTENFPDDMTIPCAAWSLTDNLRWGSSLGSDSIWKNNDTTYRPKCTYWNRFGFSCSNNQTTDELINIFDNYSVPKKFMFFYRANDLKDFNYVRIYKHFLAQVLDL